MVAGFHLVWTAYGWWLPNDPRGSSSYEIRVEKIADLGELHYGRKSIQPSGQIIKQFYDRARDALKHPLLTFEDADAQVIADSFARVIADQRYTCYACAIMPEHVHVLIRKHRHHAEDMLENLQTESREALIEAGRRAATHPIWGGKGSKRFLYTADDFARVIEYIRRNPMKIGKPIQEWPFVKTYDGWLPGRYHA
jgi:REP element-mobilizing transposase RayT